MQFTIHLRQVQTHAIHYSSPRNFILSARHYVSNSEDEDTAQELILDSDSDAHISEDEILPHESNSEKEEKYYTQWNDNTQS